MMEDSFFTQIVTKPTGGNNILELFLVPSYIRFKTDTEHKVTDDNSVKSTYSIANFNLARALLPRPPAI